MTADFLNDMARGNNILKFYCFFFLLFDALDLFCSRSTKKGGKKTALKEKLLIKLSFYIVYFIYFDFIKKIILLKKTQVFCSLERKYCGWRRKIVLDSTEMPSSKVIVNSPIAF